MLGPNFTSPSNYFIMTNSVATTFFVNAPNDSAVTLKANGVTVGSMVPLGGGQWSLPYTAPSTTQNIQMQAVGNVSGPGAANTVCCYEANPINPNISTWGSSGGFTITNGIDDPFGGTAAQRCLVNVVSGAGRYLSVTSPVAATSPLNGLEIWLRPQGGMSNMQISNGSGSNQIEIVSGDVGLSYSYMHVMERGINGWVRVWLTRASTGSNGQTISYFNFQQQFNSTTLNVPVSNVQGFDFYGARWIGTGQLPFSFYQRIQFQINPTPSGSPGVGVKQYYTKSDVANVPGNLAGGIGGIPLFNYILPTAWTAGKEYNILFMMQALPDSTETGLGHQTPEQTAINGGYADKYNCIVCFPQDRDGLDWFGIFTDGTYNLRDYVMLGLLPFVQERLGGSKNPMKIKFVGYSKSAFWVQTQKLLYPGLIGAAGGWDGNYLAAYGDAANNSCYDTSTIFLANKAITIEPGLQASINGPRSLSIHGGHVWGPDYTAYTNQILGHGVSFYNGYSDPGVHAWLNSWCDPMVAELFAMNTNPMMCSMDNAMQYIITP